MKKFLKIILCIFIVIILVIGGYASVLTLSYYRIEDNQINSIQNRSTLKIQNNVSYSIMTYNIGFGAYSQDFSFFMDGGSDSIAKNKKEVLKNTNGVLDILKEENPDFIFLQEVDIKANRSHFVNQHQHISQEFNDFSHVHTINFHSQFLFYPLLKPHGKVLSGLSFLSKYHIDKSVRRSLPVDNSWPTKFFDLDRALQVNRFSIENSNQELVLINAHLSAYDKGGIIRQKQMKMVNAILQQEKKFNNYVIIGGDYNHDLIGDKGINFTNQKVPEWVQEFPKDTLVEGYHVVSLNNAPTVRSTDVPYDKREVGKDKNNFFCVVDGFIVSDNLTIHLEQSQNIDTEFLFSDHNPVKLVFEIVS